MSKRRIYYLDVAKAFGIFAVYFGHLGTVGGHGYFFAFYSVPLFFFLAGCTEALAAKQSLGSAIRKKVHSILLPWAVFAALSLLIFVITGDSISGSRKQLRLIAMGCVRNSFFAGALWFLTCLFVISVFFSILTTFLPRWIVVGIFGLMYAFSTSGIVINPLSDPKWGWNLDSAMAYGLYYVLGYIGFKYLDNFIHMEKKWLVHLCGGVIVLLTFGLFWGINVFQYMVVNSIMSIISVLLTNMVVICAAIYMSSWFEDIQLLHEIGKNTLYLCGGEYITKQLITSGLETFGIVVDFKTPLAVYVYIAGVLLIGLYVIAPQLKWLIGKLGIIK